MCWLREEDDNCTWKMHKYRIANCIGDPSNHFMDFNFNCKFLWTAGHSESLTVALQRLVTLLLTPNSTFDAENDDKNDDWLA